MYRPSYLKLYASGEFHTRLLILNEKLEQCNVCPRDCGINRNLNENGYCHSGKNALVASYCDHHGEEPPLSGLNGSGTIFFGNCNLHCVFCQNADISQDFQHMKKYEFSADQLADIMLYLQNIKKCHNINFVSPSHFVPQIIEGVNIAINKGLRIPLVYNSNGYDSLETINLLDGIIDIYLPDLKYSNDTFARKFSSAKDYCYHSKQVIKEMYKQVGLLQVNEQGIAQKGLIIRHLVLPNDISGTSDCLNWIAKKLSNKVTISLMAQYYPANHSDKIPLLSTRLKQKEYEDALTIFEQLGFTEGLSQQLISAKHYRSHFFEREHPFE
jgi:putative pyruvate formate lyase activating enzyme